MNNLWKRGLSFMMAVFMVFSMLPVQAFALEDSHEGHDHAIVEEDLGHVSEDSPEQVQENDVLLLEDAGEAETPAEDPTEAPAETPAEDPTVAPAEDPTEAPAEAPTEEPAEAPHVHEFTAGETVPATCAAQGYTLYVCACGEAEQRDMVEALAHSYEKTVVEPTTETQGYTLYTCALCGHSYQDDFTDVLAPTAPEEDSGAYDAVAQRMDEILMKYLGTTDPMTKEQMGDIITVGGEAKARAAIEEIETMFATEGATLTEDDVSVLVSDYAHFFDFHTVLNVVFPAVEPIADASYTVAGLTFDVTNCNSSSSNTDSVVVAVEGPKSGNKTATVKITNSLSYTVDVSFTITAVADSWQDTAPTVTLVGGSTVSSGSAQSMRLTPGASVSYTIYAKGWGSSWFGGASQTTTTFSAITVTKYEGQATVSVSYNEYGAVKSGNTEIPSGTVDKVISITDALTAVPVSGATFVGWVNTQDNALISTDVNLILEENAVLNVTAVFTTSTPYFMTATMSSVSGKETEAANGGAGNNTKSYYSVDSSDAKIFDNLTDALADSGESNRKAIVLMNSGTLPAGTYTVLAGSYLLVPFDDANTLYTAAPFAVRTFTNPSWYRTLTLAEGAHIVVEGGMSISARHHAPNGGSQGAGSPSGPVGHVKMEQGSSITVNSGGALYAWGYITGSGSVVANSGANIHENFQFNDFRGGTEISGMKEENGTFPLSQYYVQNIEVPLTLHAGAVEHSYTSIYMRVSILGGQTINSASVAFIGKDSGMFQLANGYVVKRYDGSTDRLIVDIHGDISISPISMGIANINLDSGNYELPINMNITVNVHSGTTTVKQNIALLPGAEIRVESGANVQVNSGISMYLYDADQWSGYCGTGDKVMLPVQWASSKAVDRASQPLTDAKVVIGSGANVYAESGAAYTTEGGAAVTGEDNAAIKLTKGSKTSTYQYKNGGTYVEIPVTPAKLQNADGSYVTTAEYTETTIFVYRSGRWHTKDCDGVYTEEITTKATCSQEGEKTFTCTCAYNPHSYTEAIAKIDHTPGDAVKENDTAATCTADGGYDMVKRCTMCNTATETIHTTIKATGHPTDKREVIPGKAATCTATGLTNGEKCTVCGTVTMPQATIPAKGHTNAAAVKENETASTCTVAGGYDSVVYCSVCNAEVSRTHTAYDLAEHKFNVDVDEKAATCTEIGYNWHQKCSDCGTPDQDYEEYPVLGHDYDEGVVTQKPTCTGKGVKTFTCSRDNTHTYTEEIDELGHTEAAIPAVDATCTTTGSTAGVKCSVCDEVITKPETIPAKGHTPAAAVRENEVPATCETPGSYDEVVKCSVCKDEISREVKTIEALNHAWNDGVVTKLASCEENGTKVYTCTNDNSHTYTETLPATGHNYDEGVESKAPTCTDKGVKTYTCSNNPAHTKTEEIPAKGHTEETIPGKDATCSETGLTEGKKCTVCGKILTAQTTLDKLAHTEEPIPEVAPTCTTPGSTAGVKCSVCDEVIIEPQVVQALNHKEEAIPAVAPSCGTDGTTAGVKCSVCGEVLEAPKTDKAYGSHSYTSSVTKNPTCTEEGVRTFTCQRANCDDAQIGGKGRTYTESVGMAAHTPGAAVKENEKAATCYSEGSYDEVTYCTECNKELNRVQKTVEKLDHTTGEAVKENSIAATCTKAGSYEKVYYCAVEECHAEIGRETVEIKALKHEFGEGVVTTEPKCEQEGVKTFTCTRENCDKGEGHTYTAPVEALGHNYVPIQAVAATCTKPGSSVGSQCSRCQEYQIKPSETSAIGHDYDDGVITTPSTCTTEGVKTYTCQRTDCDEGKDQDGHGKTYTEPVEKKAHTPGAAVKENEKTATCYSEGSYDEVTYCTVCNEEQSRTHKTLEKLDHTKGKAAEEKRVEATCTQAGSYEEVYYCTVEACKAEIGRETVEIKALKHVFGEGEVTTQPECEQEGVRTFTCTRANCDKGEGYTYTESVKALGHDIVIDSAVPATCTSTGLTEGSHCSRCDAMTVEQTILPMLDHTWVDVEVTTEPGCETDGEKTVKCKNCEKTETRTITRLGHIWADETEVIKANTCTQGGQLAGAHCTRCDEHKDLVNTDPLGHAYNDGVTTPATCTVDGQILYTCVREGGCDGGVDSDNHGTTYTVVLTAGGHKYDNGVVTQAATCIAEGVKTFTCQNETCDDLADAQGNKRTYTVSIPMTSHTKAEPVREDEVPATCYKEGSYNEVVHCAVEGCSYIFSSKSKTIAKTAHTPMAEAVEEDRAEATCTQDGSYKMVKRCTVAECQEVLEEQSFVITAEGHQYDAGVITTPAECEKTGVKTFTCQNENCDDLADKDGHKKTYTATIPATGHQDVVVDKAVAATCTTTGLTEGSHCETCQKILVAQKEVSALGHKNDLLLEAVAATCTVAGKTSGVKCSACQEITTPQTVVDAIGHKYDNGVVTQPATCIAEGVKTFTCQNKNCDGQPDKDGHGKTYDEVIEKVAHVAGEAEERNVKAATCTVAGSYDLVVPCTQEGCEHIFGSESKIIEALGHDYDEGTVTDDPTCTEAGEKRYTCIRKDCDQGENYTYTETLGPKGHTPGTAVKENDKPATCTEAGGYDMVIRCTVCQDVVESEHTEIPAAGHLKDILIPEQPADCTKPGLTRGWRCSVCKEISVAQTVLSALGHNKDTTIPAVPATCSKEGWTEGKKCSVCGEITVEPTPTEKTAHTEVTIDGHEATCTAPGLTDGKQCSVCREITVPQKEIPVKGHTEETIPGKDATCTETGLTEGKKCSVCDEILTAQEVIGKLAHTPGETVIENEVKPTCTKPGSHDEVVCCTVCKTELSREQKIDKVLDHTPGTPAEENRVEATCDKEGSYDLVTRCTVCREVIGSEDKTIEKIPHTEVEIAAKEPTCTAAGNTAGIKCSVCDEVLKTPEPIDALDHTEEIIPAVDPTCTEPGATEGKKCSVCGTTLTDPTEIPKLGHSMVTEPAKDPTCTEDGYTAARVCENCDYVQRPASVRPATGHTDGAAVEENRVEATCTEDGSYDSVIYCVTCGEEQKRENVKLDATGHSEGAVRDENMVPPGCETEGSVDHVTYCSVCNKPCKTETGVIPATGHTEAEITAVAPTCAKVGSTVGTRCSVCEKILVAPQTVEKLPHTEEVIPAVAPTCTKPGSTEGTKCSVCGESLVAPEEVAVIDHDWGTGRVTTEPNCEDVGVRTFTCSMCHESKEEDEPALGHSLATMPAQKPTYTTAGWEEYEYCTRTFPSAENTNIPCGYSTKVEIPALGEPEIDNFADFIENLSLLETIADTYVKKVAPGKDPASLIIKYIRTGVERYNSGSWNIMAGYEDKDFAAYVAKYEAEYNLALEDGEEMMKVSGMKNLTNFALPSGDTADVGHIFGLMDISYTNYVNANVSGWAGDTVDLLSAADQYGVTSNTVEDLVTEIETKYFGKGSGDLEKEYGEEPIEGSFSWTDARGDLDGYYIIEQLVATEYENQTLTELFSGYMTPSLTDTQRAAYFLKNKLGGVTLRADVRETVFNVYSADKGVATLEGTREFKATGEKMMNMRKAVCYVFADYLCRLAGDYVDDMENEYLTIFDTKTSTLAPGITQKIYNATTADDQTMVYYVATADVTRSDVSVYANYNNNDPSQGWQMQRVLEQSLAAQAHYSDPSFAHYTENFNVVAAINGGGYNMETGEPGGLFVMEGYEWKPSDGNYFFGILKDGTALVGTHQDYLNLKAQGKVKEAIGAFGTPLIYNGEIAIGRSDAYYTSRASRTAVGVTATGKVVFMVVDGRQIGLSCGASMEEIAQIMLDAGCCAAINLDGGGSSTYVAKPEGESELKVVSNPSDGSPRSVSTSIFVASTAPSSTAFDRAVITSNYNYLTIGSSVHLTASAVSATGNVVEMPEGVTWAVDDETLGAVDQDGNFTAAANGTVTVKLMLDGEEVGSKKLFVVIPDNVYFDRETMSGIYGETLTLPVCAVYEGKKVVINENDVIISLTPENAGTVSGFTMVGDEASGVRQVTVVGTLAVTAGDETPITGSMNVSMFLKDEASFDFDNVSGGDRQFAFLREVSNATESGTATYRVVDPEQPMVTEYTFALDMSQIPIPEKLSDLTYMLPGADMEGASAWNFLLQLAERVSVWTNVTPELVFDKNFDVDYSEIKVSNEYFTLDESKIEFDKATNTLKLRMNWVDQEQPIDANTANPLCVVTGIKLTPKADANWGSSETLRPVNAGTISYDIYLRTNALYSFASKPENQEKFGLYPFDNKDVIINGGTEKGGHFSEVYTTFQDTYTLMNGQKEGWVMEDGGWAYYENGARYTGFRVVDGLYYYFGTDGINIGQKVHTGPMTIDGKEYYAVEGKMFYGWQVVDIYNVSYYNETTGVKEELHKDEVPSDCIIDGHCDYTSESGATKHIDYDDAGGHEWPKNSSYQDEHRICTVCGYDQVNIETAKVELDYYVTTYTGGTRRPATTVTAPDGTVLTKPPAEYNDYSSEHKNNIDVGTASVTVTAKRYGKYGNLNDWFGNAAGSVTVNFEIRPDLPTNIKTRASAEKPNVAVMSWTAAKAPDVMYVLYKSTDGEIWTEANTTTATSFEIDVTAHPGSMWKIGTRKIVDGKAYESLTKSSTQYPAPIVTLSMNDEGKPTLKWSDLPGQPVHYVYRALGDGDFVKVAFESKGLTYTHKSAAAGNEYSYKVVADFGENEQSLFSSVVTVAMPCAAPVVQASVGEGGRPVLTWAKVQGAAAYIVTRSETADGTFAEIGRSSTLTFTDPSAKPGKTYYYQVTAMSKKNVLGTPSEAVQVDTGEVTPVQPVLQASTSINAATGKPTVKWEAPEKEVLKYEVYRSATASGTFTKVFTTTGTTYTHSSSIPGNSYFYYVVALMADGTQMKSETLKNTCEIRFSITTGNNEAGKPTLKWGKINGAKSYTVTRYEVNGGAETGKFSTTGTTYTNTAAEAGKTYFYKLTVKLSNGKSFTSDQVSVLCLSPAMELTVTTGNNDAGKPTVDWNHLTGAEGYVVYRYDEPDGKLLGTFKTKGTSYTNTGAEYGKTYYYKVEATMSDGKVITSKLVSGQCIRPATELTVTTGNNANGKPTVDWNHITGAEGYVVYRYDKPDGKLLGTFKTKGTSYTNTGAEYGKTYYYKVEAIMPEGEVITSKLVSAKCILPKVEFYIITGNNMETGKPTLKWRAIVGAEKYNLYYSENENGPWTKSPFETRGTTYTNTAAKPNELYYYKLEVTLVTGEKVMSHVVSNSCLIPSYEFNIITDYDRSTGKPLLKWTPIIGAERYEVYRSNFVDGEFVKVFETEANTYRHISAKAGKTYYYKLKVYMVDGKEDISDVVQCTCKAAPQ